MSPLWIFGIAAVLFLVTPAETEARIIYKDNAGPDLPGQKITRIKIAHADKCGDSPYSCGQNASCVNDKCVCDKGLHGEPRLACLPQHQLMSSVTGDPKLSAFDGSHSHMQIACRSLLTEIVSHHNMGRHGGKCHVKIFSILHHRVDGYFLWAIGFELTVTDHSKPWVKGETAMRVYGFQEGEYACYKEHGHSHNEYKTGRHFSGLTGSIDQMLKSSYDLEHNLVHLDVPDCGIFGTFRAHVHGSHLYPGFVVGVDKANAPLFPPTSAPLASSPYRFGTPLIIQEKHLKHLTKDQMTLYQSLTQDVDQDFGLQGLSCSLATKMFNHLCIDDASKAFAIKLCSEFYFNETIMACLHSSEFGISSSSMFGFCTQAACLSNVHLCDDLKKENTYLGCPLAEALRSVECADIGAIKHKFEGELLAHHHENLHHESIHKHGFH